LSRIFWKRFGAFFDWVAFGVGASGAAVLGIPSGKFHVGSLGLGCSLFAVAALPYWSVTAVLHLAELSEQQVD
jgi:hypothetical protein